MKLRTSRTNFKFILFLTFISMAICLPVLEDEIEAKINSTHVPDDDLENNSTELFENESEVSNSTELFEIDTKINSTEKFEFDDWTEEDESNGKTFRNLTVFYLWNTIHVTVRGGQASSMPNCCPPFRCG